MNPEYERNQTVKLGEKKHKFITDGGISIVNFYVSWSFYSRIQKLFLEKFKSVIGDNVKIYNVNADDNKMLIEKYAVTSYPTILIFKNGENVSHLTGLQDNFSLFEAVKKFILPEDFSRN